MSPISGYIVTLYGWYNLFVFSFIISLPCLFLLFLTKKNILLANQDQEDISKEEQSLNINESIAIED